MHIDEITQEEKSDDGSLGPLQRTHHANVQDVFLPTLVC